MKKILLILSCFMLVGCTDLSNTPTKRVEEFLKKYQTLDEKVLTDLDNAITYDYNFSTSQANKYREIMKQHYQNMTYKIKDEKIDGNKATVTVEIEVTDFKKVIDDANAYMNAHQQEFLDESGVFSILKFNDYRLEKLKESKEKIKYTIYFTLTKQDKKWNLDNLNQITYDKLNGIYNY